MQSLKYLRPDSMEEALRLLREHGPAARPLAGGTDLLLQIRHRRSRPEVLVSLQRLAGLAAWEEREEAWRLGALTRLAALAGPARGKQMPLLREVTRQMGSPEIRNVATLGGNICNADPAADLLPPLIAMGTAVELASANGSRRLPLSEFYRGPHRTVLDASELLIAVEIPRAACRRPWGYVVFASRPTMGISLATATCVLLEADGRVQQARLVLGAVGEHPLVLELDLPPDDAEAGDLVEEKVKEALAKLAVREHPQVPAWYLRRRAALAAREALAAARRRAGDRREEGNR